MANHKLEYDGTGLDAILKSIENKVDKVSGKELISSGIASVFDFTNGCAVLKAKLRVEQILYSNILHSFGDIKAYSGKNNEISMYNLDDRMSGVEGGIAIINQTLASINSSLESLAGIGARLSALEAKFNEMDSTISESLTDLNSRIEQIENSTK